jgi:putative peptide zinc metalloprotease protein
VEAGTALFSLSNRPLSAYEVVSSAYVKEVEARRVLYLSSDPVKAAIARDELEQARNRLSRAQSETKDLTVRSNTPGTFIVPAQDDLPSRFVRKGELLGYVVEADRMTIRAVVSQTIIDLVRNRTEGAEVRLSENIPASIPAEIKRLVPGATVHLPARQLSTAGGGKVATDPTDGQGLTAIQKMFQIDLEIPSGSNPIKLGGRAYVRFNHGWAPLAVQWYFQIRQIFLSRFDV